MPKFGREIFGFGSETSVGEGGLGVRDAGQYESVV